MPTAWAWLEPPAPHPGPRLEVRGAWADPTAPCYSGRVCGRITLTTPPDLLADEIGLTLPAGLAPRYNIAPTQPVLVVPNREPRSAGLVRWGLIPSWARDPRIGSRLINARAETLAERPSFRVPLERRRCLVLADGFYEWKRDGRSRTPIYFRLASGRPFAFAGLWDIWRSPTGGQVGSCAIVTTAPNELVAPIHDRMPVILPRDAWDRWIDPRPLPPDSLADLLAPYPADELLSYPVSPLVNSPDNDRPECIQPIAS